MKVFFPFLTGVIFGIFFLWSPKVSFSDGQNKKDQVVSSADTTTAIGKLDALMFQLPELYDSGDSVTSIYERLNKAELELFWLKRQRHELLKALENKQYHLPSKSRKPRQEDRRPST